MRTRVDKLAFNRGIVSRRGLARSDIKRLAFAAEFQKNWICRVLGSMTLRPGTGYLGSTKSDQVPFFVPFVFSITDKAKLEITNQLLRVWVNDVVIARAAVSTAVTNGSFTSDVTGWTDADESGATSAWVTGGYMGLTGNGTSFAIRRQALTVAAADQNVEHALRIIVQRGPVVLRVGSSSGEDDLITETALGTGTHSLAFTPTGGTVYVEFKSRLKRIVLVDSCTIEAAGDVEVTAPWIEAQLPLIRHDQSGDIIYVACDGYQQYTIERRSTTSWSVVKYEPEDGPFRVLNVSTTTIAAAAISGNTTLTASKPLFRSGHVGALFQITSVGQTVTASITAENTFTNSIRVTGVTTARSFTLVLTGLTGTGTTVTLQRSFDNGASWVDLASYTTDQSTTYTDGLDNQIILYRIGVKTGDYSSGTIAATLAITTGSITGVARVTDFSSSTSVGAEIITDLGGTTATEDWAEGQWSTYRGYPSAVSFHEGRLVWSGRDKIDHSISDAFDAFDPDFEGDAGPISRSIGAGPVDSINWLLSLQRLIAGGQGSEFSVRSSSLDEPLTPTNYNIKQASTQGSAPVAAVKVDQTGVFVQRGGTRIYELAFGQSGVDYEASHLSALCPEIGQPGIVKILVQRQPDTRLHFIRSDGTVALMILDKLEEVVAFMEIETDGNIEDGCVLPGDPGDEEDKVYYAVARSINGATKRYVEKWAMESECEGAAICKLADAHVAYTGVSTDTVTGAGHLEGERVVVWADGADVGTDEDPFLDLTGAAGTQASAPFDPSTIPQPGKDFSVIVRMSADDWTPATDFLNVVANWDGSGGVGALWYTALRSSGVLRIQWVNAAGTTLSYDSTAPVPALDGAAIWWRAQVDGQSGNVTFSTSEDGVNWSQLGDVVVGAGAVNFTQIQPALSIGARDSGTHGNFAGHIHYAELQVDGVPVMLFDPPTSVDGSTFTASTGQVFTLEGVATITNQKYKVSAGQFTLPVAASNIVYGLPYESSYKSGKFVELMAQPGASLSDSQNVRSIVLLLADVHAKGLLYGPSLTEAEMRDLPSTEAGAPVDDDAVRTEYAFEAMTFPGTWDPNARICLKARAPRPVTVLAAIAEVEHHG